MRFRELRADEIDVRVGSVSQKGATLLLYKDARCDMNILDETVGPGNWQRDHKEVKGNLYCGVGLWDEQKTAWVWKWDCGTESYTEKEKGEASDSFKRACFNWGIGRELYTAPFTFINCDTEQKGDKYYLTKDSQRMLGNAFVSDIQYQDGKIVSVTVRAKNGDILFGSGAKKRDEKPALNREASPAERKTFQDLCKALAVSPVEILKDPRVGWEGGRLTQEQYGKALVVLKEISDEREHNN